MTNDTEQNTDGQSPTELGKKNAQRLLADSLDADRNESPVSIALDAAIENHKHAQQQANRAQNILRASAMTITVLESVEELDGNGLLADLAGAGDDEGTVAEQLFPEDTAGIDDTSGEVAEGFREEVDE